MHDECVLGCVCSCVRCSSVRVRVIGIFIQIFGCVGAVDRVFIEASV